LHIIEKFIFNYYLKFLIEGLERVHQGHQLARFFTILGYYDWPSPLGEAFFLFVYIEENEFFQFSSQNIEV
jgi:hypothetical protein